LSSRLRSARAPGRPLVTWTLQPQARSPSAQLPGVGACPMKRWSQSVSARSAGQVHEDAGGGVAKRFSPNVPCTAQDVRGRRSRPRLGSSINTSTSLRSGWSLPSPQNQARHTLETAALQRTPRSAQPRAPRARRDPRREVQLWRSRKLRRGGGAQPVGGRLRRPCTLLAANSAAAALRLE